MRRACIALGLIALLSGCIERNDRAVYLLVDVSGSYHRQLAKSADAAGFVLASLRPGDWVALAKIGSRSFSDREVLFRLRLSDRPSEANAQKIALKKAIDRLRRTPRSAHTDIRGAIMQAADALQHTQARRKLLVIFSDLAEDLPKDVRRQGALPPLQGIDVLAVNVTKLWRDNRDPSRYFRRLERWRRYFEQAGAASFRILPDATELASVFD